MPDAYPLIEDTVTGIPSTFEAGGQLSGGGQNAGINISAGPGVQTHLWMAGVMLLALIAIIVLHVTGFRFATDVGVTTK